MSKQEIPQHHPSIIWRVLDDGVVVVSPQQGQVRVLNQVGTTVWGLIDGRRTVADLAAALTEQYNVSPEEAGRDLRAFLAELTDRGLLQWSQPGEIGD
jgi:hypothetical protein